MVNELLAQGIERQFDFNLNYLDFFYPYTEAKGYEDVENETTDEEYDALETEFFKNLPQKEIVNLKYKIQDYINEQIKELMEKTVQKGD